MTLLLPVPFNSPLWSIPVTKTIVQYSNTLKNLFFMILGSKITNKTVLLCWIRNYLQNILFLLKLKWWVLDLLVLLWVEATHKGGVKFSVMIARCPRESKMTSTLFSNPFRALWILLLPFDWLHSYRSEEANRRLYGQGHFLYRTPKFQKISMFVSEKMPNNPVTSHSSMELVVCVFYKNNGYSQALWLHSIVLRLLEMNEHQNL